MLYLIDSLNTITDYNGISLKVESVDKDWVIGALLYEDYKAFLHTRSVEVLKKDIRILDLINIDPLTEVPDIKENDNIIYYDYANNTFFLLEV